MGDYMGALVSVFIVPLMLLNFFGGIVSGIWLAILGQWWAVGYGIASMFISHFILSFVLLPSLLLGAPGAALFDKGRVVLGMPFLLLSQIYTYAVITIWCLLSFHLFMSRASFSTFWPLLIWSYGVALGPWMYMASKEAQAGPSASSTTTFFAQIAYLLISVIVIFGQPTLLDLGIVFSIVMLIGMLIQTSVGVLEALAYRRIGGL